MEHNLSRSFRSPMCKALKTVKGKQLAQTEKGPPNPKTSTVFFYKKGNYAPVPTAVNNIRNSSGRPLYRMKSQATKISYVLYPEGNSINTIMLCNYAMPLSWGAQNVLQRWVRTALLKDLQTTVESLPCRAMWKTDYFLYASLAEIKKQNQKVCLGQ